LELLSELLYYKIQDNFQKSYLSQRFSSNIMSKVSLDALVPREDFEVESQQGSSIARITTLAIRDLEKSSFFFSAVRKPDFQRETNEWSPQKICDLIESFLEGDLIPAVILWRGSSSYTFVIDGSHRLSALAAWINNDYGDGEISKHFYDGIIPDEQLTVADTTRKLIDKQVGSFKDYNLARDYPNKVKPSIVQKAKLLGTLAIQVQWVEGDSSKAEASFFKINQKASQIDPTELRLLQARKKPNGVAARAIIRSGKGHKYWSSFSQEKQDQIQSLAKEINSILFNPDLKNPVKTLDLPIAGKNYSSQSLGLILDFVNIVNNVKDEQQDDPDGDLTIQFLVNCRKIARRINSSHASSLGLHPAIYFYSREGKHKPASVYSFTALIIEFESKNLFSDFTKVRSEFEILLLETDYLVPHIVRKYRNARVSSYKYLKDFHFKIIQKLLQGKQRNLALEEVMSEPLFSYLHTQFVPENNDDVSEKAFSKETKSAAFIREALCGIPKCKICGGHLHVNSISIDHIQRKADGGMGCLDNAQLTHPYCNTTFKN
jgi:Protein of unknown function DUF262/HNH endonuclease